MRVTLYTKESYSTTKFISHTCIPFIDSDTASPCIDVEAVWCVSVCVVLSAVGSSEKLAFLQSLFRNKGKGIEQADMVAALVRSKAFQVREA